MRVNDVCFFCRGGEKLNLGSVIYVALKMNEKQLIRPMVCLSYKKKQYFVCVDDIEIRWPWLYEQYVKTGCPGILCVDESIPGIIVDYVADVTLDEQKLKEGFSEVLGYENKKIIPDEGNKFWKYLCDDFTGKTTNGSRKQDFIDTYGVERGVLKYGEYLVKELTGLTYSEIFATPFGIIRANEFIPGVRVKAYKYKGIDISKSPMIITPSCVHITNLKDIVPIRFHYDAQSSEFRNAIGEQYHSYPSLMNSDFEIIKEVVKE